MANVINIKKILDGPRNVVFHIYLKSDGVTGEIVDYIIADPADQIIPETDNVPSLAISELWYDLPVGLDVSLKFEYLLEDTPVWSLSAGNSVHICFDSIGGLTDRSQPQDGTGRLLLTTKGLLEDQISGTIIVKLKKKGMGQ